MVHNQTIIHTQNLHRVYLTGGEDVHAVNDVSLTVEEGKLTVIVGRSGAGKTTLLNLMSGLDEPTQGSVIVDGDNLQEMNEAQRLIVRRDKIGFIFQSFGLLPLLSAAENVSVPLRMRKTNRKQRIEQVNEALDWVGLSKRAGHRPYELSGGEQQRVAIARALVAQPKLILADEPTGQLDSQTGKRVLSIMRQLVDERGITMVIVTHDQQVVDAADKIYRLHDGILVDPLPIDMGSNMEDSHLSQIQ